LLFKSAVKSHQSTAQSIDNILRITASIQKPAYLAFNRVQIPSRMMVSSSQPMKIDIQNYGDSTISNVWVKLSLSSGFQSNRDSIFVERLNGNQTTQVQFVVQAPAFATTGSYSLEFVNIGQKGTLPFGNSITTVTQATALGLRRVEEPQGFRLLAPQNRAQSISPTRIRFRWAAATQPIYNFQISTDTNFVYIPFNQFFSDTSVTITDFSAGRWYYWRVRSLNGDWSPVWSFYTGNLLAAAKAPDDGASLSSSSSSEPLRSFIAARNEDVSSILRLTQHPNPFSHTTTLEYLLPREAHVRMDICNMLGQTLLTPVSGMETAGAHTVDVVMNNFPSGVYVVRMSAGGQVLTRQMTLIR
jgi:hypothetical protein